MYKTRNLPNTRIDVADALRGIAVAGIILYHSVEHFNIFTQEPIVHTLASDQTVADVLAWLLSGKMYGIFAMLFGLSFFIMNDNQQQKGKNFSLRFAWRMCLLFMFGIINVTFYDGDILMLYACYGLLLIPISYLPSKWVWCIGYHHRQQHHVGTVWQDQQCPRTRHILGKRSHQLAIRV